MGAEVSGVIFDIQRYVLHDGPGIRTTVFFKGCPLRCAWCHNPESYLRDPEPAVWPARCRLCGECMRACPEGYIRLSAGRIATDLDKCTRCGRCVDACVADARRIIGQEVTVAQVLTEIEKDVIFFDESGGGVTFSGGEPLMQARFLGECLRQCRRMNIHAVVDTTLYAAWDVIADIVEMVDLWLCDLKHLDSQVHRRLTGAPNEEILANLLHLSGVAKKVVVRVPVIPGLNDSPENVQATGRFVRSLSPRPQLDLLVYNRHGLDKAARLSRDCNMFSGPSVSMAHVQEIADVLKAFDLDVRIGG